MAGKSPDAFRTISEVADWLDRPAHVLRFWESKFSQIKPVKRAGGRRYYRPEDMLLLGGIKKLLHDDGMTIKGAQKLLRDQGVRYVSGLSQPLDEDTAALIGVAEEVVAVAVAGVVVLPSAEAEVEAEVAPAADLFDAPQPLPPQPRAPLGTEGPPQPVLISIAPAQGILGLIAARHRPIAAADRAALAPVLARLDDLIARLSQTHDG
jgi:DNA-binding transcriptional MerR regulator